MPPTDAPALAADPPPATCLNCGEPLGAPPPNFCPACGQDTRVRAPTMREFAQQFTGQYLSSEGAMWRTLALLFFQPGELTRRYIAGRRRHYVLPVRLYLTISLVALLALRLSSGVTFELSPDAADTPAVAASGASAPEGGASAARPARARPFADAASAIAAARAASAASAGADAASAPEGMSVQILGGRTGIRDGHFYCDDLPGWFCRRLEDRFDQDERGLAREMRRVSERFIANLGAAMFVLVPMFAFWMRVAWIGRGMRYAEHLVYSLHLHAFWFAMVLVALPGVPYLTDAALWAVPLYALLASRRVYGGGWFGTLARNAVVALAYFMTIAVALAGVGVWSAVF